MKKTLLLIIAFFVSVSNLMAEDADSLYARDLLKPGTENFFEEPSRTLCCA